MAIRGLLSVLILLAAPIAMAQDFGEGSPPWKGAAESLPDYPGPPKPLSGAPDILLVVLDDVGFAGLSSFGGRIDTPNLDRLSHDGLRYTAFNVAPIGAATRAALLTGRNPHTVGMADEPEAAGSYPGRSGGIPSTIPLLPAMLKPYGYAAFALGPWHLVPTWARSAATGYFEQWPTQRGFDHFYGWLSGSTHQWYPELYRDTTPVAPPKSPGEGYHVSEDLVDNAIRYIDDLRSADPERPFLMYLAFGAAGAPQQAPRRYRELYRGRFAEGWDRERDMVFERQKVLGLVPPDTLLPPRGPGIREWAKLDPDRQLLFQSFMENYAGFLTHADAQIGRLVDHLRTAGRLDNTLILVLSDNGASAEGGADGVLNRVAKLNGIESRLNEMLARRAEIGDPSTAPVPPWGWASITNLPFRGGEGSADNGGIRVPFIVHWPKGVANPGSIRRQWQFVTDVVPTILDILKVPPPAAYRGAALPPLHGFSFMRSFAEAEAPSTHATQYWESRGNRAIYFRGWKAVAAHAGAEGRVSMPSDFDRKTWRLYFLDKDFAETEDLSAKHPDRLAEMTARFWSEAGRDGIFPLDGRTPLQPPAPAGEAALSRARVRQFTFFPGMSPLPESLAPDLFEKSYSVTVALDRREQRTDGVLAAQGGITGGWALYIRGGKPKFVYNSLGSALYTIEGADELPADRVKIRYRFTKSRNHTGKGELFIEGRKIGEAAIDRLIPATFGTEPFDVGRDSQSPVSPDYQPPFAYTGSLERVEVDIED